MRIEDMSDEELLREFAYAAQIECDDAPLREELLRRLSAGNPQGEKVQITAMPGSKWRCDIHGVGLHTASCQRSGEQSETRIQGATCAVVGCGVPIKSGGTMRCAPERWPWNIRGTCRKWCKYVQSVGRIRRKRKSQALTRGSRIVYRVRQNWRLAWKKSLT